MINGRDLIGITLAMNTGKRAVGSKIVSFPADTIYDKKQLYDPVLDKLESDNSLKCPNYQSVLLLIVLIVSFTRTEARKKNVRRRLPPCNLDEQY